MSPLNNTSDLKGSSGILSTIPMNSMGAGQSVQQNASPIIFSKGVEVGKELSMSAAHSNIARLVTKNEKGATSIADIVNKKFDEDITLSSALEKLESAQDYNEDMKAVVFKFIEKASSNEDKIAVLEKGLAFLETEKKLSDLVQSGKMGLDEAKALLTKSLDFGCSKDFSLEKLNEFNEFSMNENDESAIQQKASKVFGTEVSTVNSPVNNDQSLPQSTNQLSKNQEVATKETNESPSKTIDKKQDNQAEPKGEFEKIITTPQEAKHSVENHETKEKINLLGKQEMELFSKTLSNLSSQESKIEIKQGKIEEKKTKEANNKTTKKEELSDTTKNVLKTLLKDYLHVDDFENLCNEASKKGAGSEGEVYEVGKYAVKIFKNNDDNAINNFNNEKTANDTLKSGLQTLNEEEQNLFANYYGSFEIDGKLVVVTEFVQGGSFLDYLKKDENHTKETIPNTINLFKQAFDKIGVEEKLGFVNRDIKPENFMIEGSQLKGIDNGTLCGYANLNTNDLTCTCKGSTAYMAPEQNITFTVKDSGASPAGDVYSVACSLLEGLFKDFWGTEKMGNFIPTNITEFRKGNKIPFGDPPSLENFIKSASDYTKKQVNLAEKYKDRLAQFSPEQKTFLANFLADCMKVEPQDRISAKQAAYLLGKFNEGSLNYTELKQGTDYPQKAIPKAIMDMILSPDKNKETQGKEALDRLIKADSSYATTETYTSLQARDKIFTIIDNNSYKHNNSSSQRRQMILAALSESMDNATLDSILKDKRCSRGVKTALLLSPNLPYEQKLEVVNSDKNNEIVAYCQKHKNVFQQVRSALTPTSKITQRRMQFISKDSPTNIFTNLKRFVDALFDKNGQFTIPNDIEAARNFFNPSTFTTEERAKIVELLKEKKKQIGNASTSLKTMEELNNVNQEKQINRLKIDLMIAQFQQDDEAMINATLGVANEMFNFVNNKIFDEKFNTLEPLQESQLSKLLDQTQSMVDIQNVFWKDLEPAKNDQQTKYNNCYRMLCGQLLTKESLLIRDLLGFIQNNDKQKINNSLVELKEWNITLTDKQTMLNMLSKDNYENTLNREKLYQLKLETEHSFNGTEWDNFDTNCKDGLNSFNLATFKTRYTNEQEAQNRKNLQDWLKGNNITINVDNYSLDQMDKLISDVEKAVKNNPSLGSVYTS